MGQYGHMKTVFSKIKRFVSQVRGLFPSQLPQGVPEFTAWADSIMNTYDLPTTDRDSVHLIFATMIMHLGSASSSFKADVKSKYFFAVALRNAAARQVAGSMFQDIKLRQAAAQSAAKPEATPPESQVVTQH